MKITIKTLKQEAFHIEVDLEKDTVRTLKEKFFQESKQDYPVERQRLIYLGKIMEDDDPLSQYNLDDKKFVVVMNKKPATAPAEPAAATTSAAPAAAKSSTESTPAAAAAAEKPKEEDKPKEDKKPEPEPPQDDIQIKIQRITEMGYSEEEARISARDLRATIRTGPSGRAGWRFARTSTTFLEMKRLLQEDPSLLPQLLQKIQSSNPDLMRIISENQVEFLALINEGAEGTGGSDGGRSGGGVPRELETTAAAMVDSLTQSDMDAIDRLKALGYPEHLVIQAYIACERNEYQAAEFLVSQTLDDDE
ncbi:hypothetical protein quinque_015886 [Culex quinquefasciatus]